MLERSSPIEGPCALCLSDTPVICQECIKRYFKHAFIIIVHHIQWLKLLQSQRKSRHGFTQKIRQWIVESKEWVTKVSYRHLLFNNLTYIRSDIEGPGLQKRIAFLKKVVEEQKADQHAEKLRQRIDTLRKDIERGKFLSRYNYNTYLLGRSAIIVREEGAKSDEERRAWASSKWNSKSPRRV